MEINTGFILEVSRVFKVDAGRLYRAWTDFDDLKQWWNPINSELVALENELKENGKIKYTFKRQAGDETYSIEGEYSEVMPAKKLVYSWIWNLPEETSIDNNYKLTVQFENSDEGSLLTVKQEGLETKETAKPHREGWESALEALESYLNHTAIRLEASDEVAGYNESSLQQKVEGEE